MSRVRLTGGGGGPGTQKSKGLCPKNSQLNIFFCRISFFPTMKSRSKREGGVSPPPIPAPTHPGDAELLSKTQDVGCPVVIICCGRTFSVNRGVAACTARDKLNSEGGGPLEPLMRSARGSLGPCGQGQTGVRCGELAEALGGCGRIGDREAGGRRGLHKGPPNGLIAKELGRSCRVRTWPPTPAPH